MSPLVQLHPASLTLCNRKIKLCPFGLIKAPFSIPFWDFFPYTAIIQYKAYKETNYQVQFLFNALWKDKIKKEKVQ